MDLVETLCDGVDWIGLVQEWDQWRDLVNAIMNLRILYNAGKLPSDYTTDGLSSSAQLHRGS
jgi:hypothetical protein